MKTFLLSCLALLAACQSPKTAQQVPTSQAGPPAGQVTTAAEAKAAVARYLRQQPQAPLYVPDSASVVEAGGRFQVLVPRTDWVARQPNRAAFEVDKATGAVTVRPVK